MDFSITSVNPFGDDEVKGEALLLKGEIIPGDYERLVQFAVHNNIDLTNEYFILSSLGGDISEALKIGRLLKNLYGTVWVGPNTGKCASACFIIFASAVNRHSMAGLVGIHRPYVDQAELRSLPPKNAEALENQALLDAETYLHQLRVPTYLVDRMFQHASSEIYWLSNEDLVFELGTRAPWYEEFLIARCGFDKGAELQYIRNSETSADVLHSMLIPAEECGSRLTRPEALAYYNKAAAPYGMHFTLSASAESLDVRQAPTRVLQPPNVTSASPDGNDAAGHQTIYAALDATVPNWRTVNNQKGFLSWLDHTDAFVGQSRRTLLKAAFDNNDAPRVVAIFKAYIDGKMN